MTQRVRCGRCNRLMKVTSSIRGYGPRCAERLGLTVVRIRPAVSPRPEHQPAEPIADQLSLLDINVLKGAA
jgi:hypothetical protein